jgi:hypothetical protein
LLDEPIVSKFMDDAHDHEVDGLVESEIVSSIEIRNEVDACTKRAACEVE